MGYNFEDLTEFLKITKLGVVSGSDFLSADGADRDLAREYLEKQIKEFPEGITLKDTILAAKPTPSHFIRYELGCGLQFIMPVNKETGEIVTFNQIEVKEKYERLYGLEIFKDAVNPFDFKAIDTLCLADLDDVESALQIDKKWIPLEITDFDYCEFFKDIDVDTYNFRDMSKYIHLFYKEIYDENDTSLEEGEIDTNLIEFQYYLEWNQDNQKVIDAFSILYDFNSDNYNFSANVTLQYDAEKKEYFPEAVIDFEIYSENTNNIDPKQKPNTEKISLKFDKDGKIYGDYDSAVDALLNMRSPNDRLDYVKTIRNIITFSKNASVEPTDESQLREYKDELMIYKPFVFK